MGCAEKGRLLLEYHSAVSEWSRATEDPGETPPGLIEHARELRDAALKAKAAVVDHIAEHGC
jgi:hypothetical protein